jgi:hypothetical protein
LWPKLRRARRLDRPIVWAILYLSMIPAFGLVYTAAAGSFYQTSATHEPSYLFNEYNAAQAIAQGAYRSVQYESYENCHNCSVPQAPIIGYNVTANASDLIATIAFTNASKDGNVAVQVDIPDDEIPSSSDVILGYSHVPYSLVSVPNESADGSGALSLQLFEAYTNSTTSPDMPITAAELNSVQQVAAAAQGTVSGLPDQFSRMLYLSAVSATTLGFGDIVPVTVVSRSLVTLEAILGVVFAGLFLNSLARRRIRQAPERDSSGSE